MKSGWDPVSEVIGAHSSGRAAITSVLTGASHFSSFLSFFCFLSAIFFYKLFLFTGHSFLPTSHSLSLFTLLSVLLFLSHSFLSVSSVPLSIHLSLSPFPLATTISERKRVSVITVRRLKSASVHSLSPHGSIPDGLPLLFLSEG